MVKPSARQYYKEKINKTGNVRPPFTLQGVNLTRYILMKMAMGVGALYTSLAKLI